MNPENTTIFVASPGTGKTTKLVSILGNLLEQGVNPNRIVYTTMSRTGSAEGRERAMKEYPQYLNESNTPFFKTLHAIGYAYCEAKQLMKKQDYIQLGNQIKVRMLGDIKDMTSEEKLLTDGQLSLGDKVISLEKIRRLKKQSYEDCFKQYYKNSNESGVSRDDVIKIAGAYEKYKKDMGLIDYTDMIDHFVKANIKLPVDYLFVDEAQDSSKLQWEMIFQIGSQCKQVYVAGDDKQCIYAFAGADPETLINLDGERQILRQSYRLPNEILRFSETVAERIKTKADYEILPNGGSGKVTRMNSLEELKAPNSIKTGTWLMIARNRIHLSIFENYCISQGVLFTTVGSGDGNSDLPDKSCIDAVLTWNRLVGGGTVNGSEVKNLYGSYLPTRDRIVHGYKKKILTLDDDQLLTIDDLLKNYGLTCKLPWHQALSLNETIKRYLKKVEANEGLLSKPRIEINTIHGVKGKEAENVVVIPDMSFASYRELDYNSDSEHRVYYVAVTRSKKNLFIMQPTNKYYYDL